MQNTITKGMILNISSNEDVFARGEKYYRDGKILSLRFEEHNGLIIAKASVEGNYKQYEVQVKLESSGKPSQYSCTCESHSIWRGACKHVVAVLFSIAEGQTIKRPGETGQQTVHMLTDALERLIFDDIDASLAVLRPVPANPVYLTPCFHYDNNGDVYLTFTIGHGRMYVVKNIQNFVTHVKREETVGYGSGLTVQHTLGAFDETSQRLIAFLLREEGIYAETIKKMNKQYQYMYNAKNSTRALHLSERSMDDFFDLYADQEIDGDVDGKTVLRLVTGMPSLRFHVTHYPTRSTLKAESFNYRAKHGVRYHYLVSQSAIYRIPQNDAMLIIYILRALTVAPQSEINFADRNQHRFLSVILPRLVKMGLIASVEGSGPVQAVETLQVRIYFDTEGRDISGQVIFVYGKQTINPLDTETPDILRDMAGEYAMKRRMALLGFAADSMRRVYVLSGNEAIYSFLHEPSGMESLRDCAEVYVSDALEAKTVKVKMPFIGLRLHGNLLDVTLDSSGYTMTDLLEALDAYRARRKFHRLKDGRFLPLDTEEVGAVAEMLSALEVSRKEVHGNTVTLPAYRTLFIDELTQKLSDRATVSRDRYFSDLTADFKRSGEMTFDIPETLIGVLREYQKIGYQWIKVLARYNFGGILADDMGLGKTLQVIAVLLSEQRAGLQSLVVAPTSLIYNWEGEIKRFAPALRATVITGLPEKRRELLAEKDTDVFITTYDMLKRDIASYEGKDFDFVIADEAQNIKNPTTQNARAIKTVKGRIRLALTGTPIENTLTELWSIFDFIMPGYLYSSHKFNRLYEHPIVRDDDASCAARLRQQIAPFVLRRIKKNVLTELPDKTETTLLAEMTTEQRKIYTAHLLKAKGEIDDMTARDGFANSRIRILAQLTRLRQICCHPALFAMDYKGGSGKLDLTLETIQRAVESGHRILLFSQFTTMLDILKDALDGSPFTYFYLDGATKAQDRMDMTDRFNAGEKDIFLISLKAGGTGLNLTGADVVIHFDPWWNPSVMDQASDRAHRYGQERAVQIFNIVAKDTIEQRIMTLQEKKRDLIDAVITEGGSFINALSEEEVRAIFNDM